MAKKLRSRLLLTLGLFLLTAPGWSEEESSEPAEPATERKTAIDARLFEHRPAVKRFISVTDPVFVRGYVTGGFSDFEEDFPSDELPPGQLLVSATANSSFTYDWAVFLGANPSESIRVLVETHFVSDPDGDFQPTIVTTEANVTWMPLGPDPLRLSVGEYWAPFGIVSDDWYSAANLFALIPDAAKAFPLHYNERGVKLEGQFGLRPDLGLNYSLSFGNGVRGLGIDDQHSKDFDNNKAVIGRLGLFPGTPRLEVGFSGMSGTLRDQPDLSAPLDDHHRYAADMQAVGLDLVYHTPSFKLRGYWISSREELIGAGDLDREGVLLEGIYSAYESDGLIKAVEPKLRLDHVRRDVLPAGELEKTVVAVGVDVWVHAATVFRFDYFFRDEREGPKRKDNGVAVRLTAAF